MYGQYKDRGKWFVHCREVDHSPLLDIIYLTDGLMVRCMTETETTWPSESTQETELTHPSETTQPPKKTELSEKDYWDDEHTPPPPTRRKGKSCKLMYTRKGSTYSGPVPRLRAFAGGSKVIRKNCARKRESLGTRLVDMHISPQIETESVDTPISPQC